MIAAVNTEVMHIINGSSAASKLKFGRERDTYNKYTSEFKAKLAIYFTIENGNCRVARKCSSTDRVIDKSSVQGWGATYVYIRGRWKRNKKLARKFLCI